MKVPGQTSPRIWRFPHYGPCGAGGGGVLPYIGYIGMCGAKGYGFLAVLV